MKKAASRLASDLPALENLFPEGFGALRRSLQGW
jgi:hypothetical protein